MHPSPVLYSQDHSEPPAQTSSTSHPQEAHHDAHSDLAPFQSSWPTDAPAARKGKGREKRAGRVSGSAAGRRTWTLGEEDDEEVEGEDVEGADGQAERGPIVQDSLLLNLPLESLHEILSYLPPSTLLLSRLVSRDLNAAIDDETLWRGSFERNFVQGGSGSVVRGCLPGAGGRSWRKEALGRERLLGRMSRSKTPSITYDPRLTSLTTLSLYHPLPPPQALPHQIRPPSLLAASLLHGLAARSDSFNGRVSKGYLDPWGVTDHTSLWSPPANTSPPTVLALSDKREAQMICWGFAEGGVGVTLVGGYATGNGKSGAKTYHSVLRDGHEGPVVSLAPGTNESVVSGGADGSVKLWAVPQSAGRGQANLKLLWEGQATREERKREIVRKVCWDERAGGLIACLTDDGMLNVWANVHPKEEGEVQPPLSATWSMDPHDLPGGDPTLTLALDLGDSPNTDGSASSYIVVHVFVHSAPSRSFKRVTFTFLPSAPASTKVTTFEPSQADSANLTCLHTEFVVPAPPGLVFHQSTSLVPTPAVSRIPSSDLLSPPTTSAPSSEAPVDSQVFHLPLSTSLEERRPAGGLATGKFVVTGDEEGVVRIWRWGGSGEEECLRRWRAVEGKITALECSMGLILVGSLEGVLRIYDPLTNPPTHLRTFNDRSATRHLRPHLAAGALDPALWRVSHIVLERDLVVACVGGKILSWKMGSGGREREGRSEWKGKVVNKKSGTSGWAGMRTPNGKGGPSQHELQSEISSARQAHREAQETLQSSIAEEQAMKAKLQGGLELTDEEHLAYALLISQEEEVARQRSAKQDSSATSSSDQPSSSTPLPEEDDMDESLREALERSLLDQSPDPETEHDQMEMVFDVDEDDDYSYRPSPPHPSFASSSRYAQMDDFSIDRSRRSSLNPTPVFGSFEDQSQWPAMLSSTPPSSTVKGKRPSASMSPSPIPPSTHSQPSWSSIARSPPSATSACRSPSLLAQSSPLLGPAGGRTVTREEREEEELRLVLEMSLNDQ